MITAMYLRVSTEEQRERQTIETQRHYAQRWLEQQAIASARFYVDDGVSGTLPLDERPAGRQLLADANAGELRTVVVYKVDRLGRDPLVTMQAASDLNTAGVVLRSMTETIDNLTPHGRFSLVMLCGVAGFERDTIVARSIEGTERLAREGAWLGGIVPFGYSVTGRDRDARLVVAEDPIPDLGLSEADVVRLIYRLSADDRWSSQRIADHLNALGVPTVYARDARIVRRGKRKEQTAGIWRAGRIRNLLISSTYKGVHLYGKRSKKEREPIARAVPAIVDPGTWDEAQRTLSRNTWASKRNSKRDYLLRGLIKCGTCGLTYTGSSWTTKAGDVKTYYSCNGRTQFRGLYGAAGTKCPSKAVSGNLEALVWEDIVSFAIDAEGVLEEVRQQGDTTQAEAESWGRENEALRRQLHESDAQRDRILTLYRRGVIDDEAVEQQLGAIQAEHQQIERSLGRVEAALRSAETRETQIDRAGLTLYWLVRRLDEWDGPLDFHLKRELIEDLVDHIEIESVQKDGKWEQTARVTYVFTPIADRTDRGSWRR